LFAIGDQVMVGSCRCLKENLDELRIERVCYERVMGYAEVIQMSGRTITVEWPGAIAGAQPSKNRT